MIVQIKEKDTPKLENYIATKHWRKSQSSHLRITKLFLFCEQFIENSVGDEVALLELLELYHEFQEGHESVKSNSFAITVRAILVSRGLDVQSIKKRGVRYFTNIKIKNFDVN